ncbi:MAG: DUF1549 domain-containing protein [Verrucomicrobiaceae bacterium]|nr:DUF1549 domain-containing protein [Verrucomicrobiaceae bacterium]
MKTRVLLASVLGLIAMPALHAAEPTTVAPDGNTNFRVWHDTQGRPLEATFRGIEDGNIFLQARNGFVHRIALDRMSPEDQTLAKSLKVDGLGIPADPNVAQAAAVIDRLVLAGLTKAGQKPNALASDEQFIRRVYLDLAGRIPTREETIRFLSDTSSSKRAKVIDSLVKGEGMTSRLFNYFGDMLRIADEAQKARFFTYEEWLKNQIAENRGWDKIVYDMMTADGKLLENGATGYLLRDKGMRLDNLSITMTTFLGANVACAQCHDHPFADWTQHQFYQMAAFFGATDTYNPAASRRLLAGMKDEFPRQVLQRAKRVLQINGMNVVDTSSNEVALPDDYKYKDGKPGDSVAPKLITWSRDDERTRLYQESNRALAAKNTEAGYREIFAHWMTSPDNPRFAMTIANRMWKMIFGVGVKEPITDLDDPNAASNPALLHHLASEMKRLNFDLRAFLRLLANTETYQREAVTAEINPGEPYYFPGPILRRMTAEQAWDSCVTLAIGEKVDQFKLKRAAEYSSVMNINLEKMTPDEARARLTAAVSAGKNAGGGKGKKGKKGMRRPAAATESEEGEPEFTRPETLDGLVLARASELPQPERDDHFLRMFGQSDRQIADSNTEEGSIPQVLMLMNGEAQHVLQNPRSVALATANGQASPEAQIQALYVSFLSRNPTTEEMAEAKSSLAAGLTTADVSWVLFNAREFVFVQ